MNKSIIIYGMMQTKPFEYNGSGRTERLAIVVEPIIFYNSNSTPQKKYR